jgi:hypothetical protein
MLNFGTSVTWSWRTEFWVWFPRSEDVSIAHNIGQHPTSGIAGLKMRLNPQPYGAILREKCRSVAGARGLFLAVHSRCHR